MLKDNWEEKHGINLPVQATFPNGIQGTPVGNMILQPHQGFSHNDHLAGSSSRSTVAALTSSKSTSEGSFPSHSNLDSINQPSSTEPVSSRHQFDTQFHQQNHQSEVQPTSNVSSVDSNLQDLIKFLSANYGPMKTPLEVGSPEYLKLVEILQQSPIQPNGFSGQLNVRGYSRGEDESSIWRDNQEKIIGNRVKNDSSLDPSKIEEKKPPSENAARVSTEKLWEGSLQLSSSVTLSAIAFFKSGEKLVGHSWPEFIEVKGKVRLEAFEKYVQDLPRSRNRGLMVTSVCWNEESSNIGLAGMKEVTKGYKKSSRVGFAQLLPGIDLYICPRSDPIITILAKYGFFKGMAVIDDKPDSMIGCVVWRKNRPVNPIGNTSDAKASPDSIQLSSPPGFSTKPGAEKQPSPEKVPPKTSQHIEPSTLPLTVPSTSPSTLPFTAPSTLPLTSPFTTTSVEVDHNGGNSSSSSSSLQNSISSDPCNLMRKRPFVDDDLPEFDFTVASGKSTLVSQPLNPISSNNRLASVACQKLNKSRLTQLPNNTSNGSLEQSSKKIKLFDVDDDEDMPEWCPPKLHQMPPQSTTTNFVTLPSCPPRLPLPPPPPPPPRADTHSSFSYQPFRPTISSQPPTFVRPSLPSLRPPLPPLPPPPQPQPLPLWHQPGSFNANRPFPPSNGRRSQP